MLEQIKLDGLARSIGVSNFREEDIAAMADSWVVRPAVNQVRLCRGSAMSRDTLVGAGDGGRGESGFHLDISPCTIVVDNVGMRLIFTRFAVPLRPQNGERITWLWLLSPYHVPPSDPLQHPEQPLHFSPSSHPSTDAQIEFHPYIQHAPNVQRLTLLMKTHDIKYQTYGPLGPVFRSPGGPVDAVAQAIADEKGATVSQVLLQWAAQYGGGTVVT